MKLSRPRGKTRVAGRPVPLVVSFVTKIDSDPSADQVAELGCPIIQGCFSSRPLAPEDLAPWVTRHFVEAESFSPGTSGFPVERR